MTQAIQEAKPKSFGECCHLVAIKHGLGRTLVTGHAAKYWTEAAEMWANSYSDSSGEKGDITENYLQKTVKGRHLMNGILFPIANHFNTHPESIPVKLAIEILKAVSTPKEHSQGHDEISLEALFLAHIEFAKSKFPESTSESSLCGLEREIDEVRKEPNSHHRCIEYIDCFMYLLDSFSRDGHTISDLRTYFRFKMDINQKREWAKNSDGSYSHKK